MFLLDLAVAFMIAFVLSAIFVAVLGWRRPGETSGAEAIGGGALFFFLILFLATWAGGAWLATPGAARGAYWFPFVVVGLLVALVLAAVVPTGEERWRWRHPRAGQATAAAMSAERERAAADLVVGFGVFFWALLIGLALAVLVAYLA